MYQAILMKWKNKLKTVHLPKSGGAMARSFNPISTRRADYAPPSLLAPRIFRPFYGSEMTLSHCIVAGHTRQERSIKLEITKKSILSYFLFVRPLLCLLSLQPYFLDFFELLMFTSFVSAILIKQNNLNISSYFSENIK